MNFASLLLCTYGIIKDESFSSIGRLFLSPVLTFLRFAMTQYMVWINFSISNLKFNYTGKFKIKKIKAPLILIGE